MSGRPEVADFLRWLGAERNDSPHTVKAYGRDLEGFAVFLDGYYGSTSWKWAGVDRLAIRGYLAQAARAHAYLRGRAYVVPEDVKAMAADVLRHRVLLTFEAEAEDVTSEGIISRILDAVDAP